MIQALCHDPDERGKCIYSSAVLTEAEGCANMQTMLIGLCNSYFLFLSSQSMDLLQKPLCVAVLKAWRATEPNPTDKISCPYKSYRVN